MKSEADFVTAVDVATIEHLDYDYQPPCESLRANGEAADLILLLRCPCRECVDERHVLSCQVCFSRASASTRLGVVRCVVCGMPGSMADFLVCKRVIR